MEGEEKGVQKQKNVCLRRRCLGEKKLIGEKLLNGFQRAPIQGSGMARDMGNSV
jgi:hypothetical protein